MKPKAEDEILMKLSVSLSDGSFDTSVSLPVESSQASKDAVVKAWFNLMQEALKMCSENAGIAPKGESKHE